MMAIYLEDSYVKDFEADITAATKNYVALDRTSFYPHSGVQPSDTGILINRNEKFNVLVVEVSNKEIVHITDRAGLSKGDKVHGCIDWDRRYKFMRSHTACHIRSAVIYRDTGAKITGNQIDLDRSRIDFNLENFERDLMRNYIEEANQIIEEDRPVRIKFTPLAEAIQIPDLMRLAIEMPEREETRIIEINGLDMQACGGTHVKRTGEVKKLLMVKTENKGKANRRIYFSLEG
ncbi:MAG: alanyl-tRNA editing protein [Methanotrichaceae archaeon]|nr:alanyl-tRNA editing protein [Methanotrichaceae archaeon]